MVSTVRPNASATPRKPMPVFGKAEDNTAAPQPPRTNQKVPISSAASRLDRGTSGMMDLLLRVLDSPLPKGSTSIERQDQPRCDSQSDRPAHTGCSATARVDRRTPRGQGLRLVSRPSANVPHQPPRATSSTA